MHPLSAAAATQGHLFHGIDLDTLAEEITQCSTRAIEAGTVILDPLRGNASIFILLEGELLVCLERRSTNPVARIKAGECVGELSIIDDRPPSAYVLAACECRLLELPREVLWTMVRKEQGIAANLLHILANRIRENNEVLLASLEMQRRYRTQAETDSLTGLHNRTWMNDIFPSQLELSEKIGQHVSLLVIDIDHFKLLNDNHGHLSGDMVLSHIGWVMRENLRTTDLCVRYGGEEFVVLMPATDAGQARATSDRLRRKIAASHIKLADGNDVSVTVSIGIAEWFPGQHLDELIALADQALYRAKDGGRNRVAISSPAFGAY